MSQLESNKIAEGDLLHHTLFQLNWGGELKEQKIVEYSLLCCFYI